MKSKWWSNYRALQQRAEFKLKEINKIQQHQSSTAWLRNARKLDQEQIQRYCVEFVRQQHQGLRQLSRYKRKSLVSGNQRVSKPSFKFRTARLLQQALCRQRSKSVYNQITRSPTYQRFERWWDNSPCPATAALLGINSIVFICWYGYMRVVSCCCCCCFLLLWPHWWWACAALCFLWLSRDSTVCALLALPVINWQGILGISAFVCVFDVCAFRQISKPNEYDKVNYQVSHHRVILFIDISAWDFKLNEAETRLGSFTAIAEEPPFPLSIYFTAQNIQNRAVGC